MNLLCNYENYLRDRYILGQPVHYAAGSSFPKPKSYDREGNEYTWSDEAGDYVRQVGGPGGGRTIRLSEVEKAEIEQPQDGATQAVAETNNTENENNRASKTESKDEATVSWEDLPSLMKTARRLAYSDWTSLEDGRKKLDGLLSNFHKLTEIPVSRDKMYYLEALRDTFKDPAFTEAQSMFESPLFDEVKAEVSRKLSNLQAQKRYHSAGGEKDRRNFAKASTKEIAEWVRNADSKVAYEIGKAALWEARRRLREAKTSEEAYQILGITAAIFNARLSQLYDETREVSDRAQSLRFNLRAAEKEGPEQQVKDGNPTSSNKQINADSDQHGPNAVSVVDEKPKRRPANKKKEPKKEQANLPSKRENIGIGSFGRYAPTSRDVENFLRLGKGALEGKSAAVAKGIKRYLQGAGVIDSGLGLTPLGQMLKEDRLRAAPYALINLVYNDPQIRWFYERYGDGGYHQFEEVYHDLVDAGYSKNVAKELVAGYKKFVANPALDVFPVGRLVDKKTFQIESTAPFVAPEHIVYALHSFTDKFLNNFPYLNLSKLNEHPLSPFNVFQADKENAKSLLFGASAKYPNLIGASFAHDLEKISLGHEDIDVADVFRELTSDTETGKTDETDNESEESDFQFDASGLGLPGKSDVALKPDVTENKDAAYFIRRDLEATPKSDVEEGVEEVDEVPESSPAVQKPEPKGESPEFPPLVGSSEKQINFANDVRKGVYRKFRFADSFSILSDKSYLLAKKYSRDISKYMVDEALRRFIDGHDKARFWINECKDNDKFVGESLANICLALDKENWQPTPEQIESYDRAEQAMVDELKNPDGLKIAQRLAQKAASVESRSEALKIAKSLQGTAWHAKKEGNVEAIQSCLDTLKGLTQKFGDDFGAENIKKVEGYLNGAARKQKSVPKTEKPAESKKRGRTEEAFPELPQLNGDLQDIAVADEIRRRIHNWAIYSNYFDNKYLPGGYHIDGDKRLYRDEVYRRLFDKKTDARFWIDNEKDILKVLEKELNSGLAKLVDEGWKPSPEQAELTDLRYIEGEKFRDTARDNPNKYRSRSSAQFDTASNIRKYADKSLSVRNRDEAIQITKKLSSLAYYAATQGDEESTKICKDVVDRLFAKFGKDDYGELAERQRVTDNHYQRAVNNAAKKRAKEEREKKRAARKPVKKKRGSSDVGSDSDSSPRDETEHNDAASLVRRDLGETPKEEVKDEAREAVQVSETSSSKYPKRDDDAALEIKVSESLAQGEPLRKKATRLRSKAKEAALKGRKDEAAELRKQADEIEAEARKYIDEATNAGVELKNRRAEASQETAYNPIENADAVSNPVADQDEVETVWIKKSREADEDVAPYVGEISKKLKQEAAYYAKQGDVKKTEAVLKALKTFSEKWGLEFNQKFADARLRIASSGGVSKENTASERDMPIDPGSRTTHPQDPRYYPIDEEQIRVANSITSHFAPPVGTETTRYRQQVDEAIEAGELRKKEVDARYHADIDKSVKRYAKKLADWINKKWKIVGSYGSSYVVGSGNYSIRKHDQKHRRLDAHNKSYAGVEELFENISRIGVPSAQQPVPEKKEPVKKPEVSNSPTSEQQTKPATDTVQEPPAKPRPERWTPLKSAMNDDDKRVVESTRQRLNFGLGELAWRLGNAKSSGDTERVKQLLSSAANKYLEIARRAYRSHGGTEALTAFDETLGGEGLTVGQLRERVVDKFRRLAEMDSESLYRYAGERVDEFDSYRASSTPAPGKAGMFLSDVLDKPRQDGKNTPSASYDSDVTVEDRKQDSLFPAEYFGRFMGSGKGLEDAIRRALRNMSKRGAPKMSLDTAFGEKSISFRRAVNKMIKENEDEYEKAKTSKDKSAVIRKTVERIRELASRNEPIGNVENSPRKTVRDGRTTGEVLETGGADRPSDGGDGRDYASVIAEEAKKSDIPESRVREELGTSRLSRGSDDTQKAVQSLRNLVQRVYDHDGLSERIKSRAANVFGDTLSAPGKTGFEPIGEHDKHLFELVNKLDKAKKRLEEIQERFDENPDSEKLERAVDKAEDVANGIEDRLIKAVDKFIQPYSGKPKSKRPTPVAKKQPLLSTRAPQKEDKTDWEKDLELQEELKPVSNGKFNPNVEPYSYIPEQKVFSFAGSVTPRYNRDKEIADTIQKWVDEQRKMGRSADVVPYRELFYPGENPNAPGRPAIQGVASDGDISKQIEYFDRERASKGQKKSDIRADNDKMSPKKGKKPKLSKGSKRK